jgi:hypothetical protein
MQEIIMNKIISISKKTRKKLRLARYPALARGRVDVPELIIREGSDAR